MKTTLSGLIPQDFEEVFNGKNIRLFVLKNSNGCEVCICNFGATLLSFVVPDKNGKMTDITLGQTSVKSYIEVPDRFFSTSVGRYSNRIAGGKFSIDGHEYTLPINNDINNLHSGSTGFHNCCWDLVKSTSNSLILVHVSPDGEGGFPGTLTTTQTWTLTEENELIFHNYATTDKATPCSITSHAFFNLEGDFTKDCLSTNLKMYSHFYCPADQHMIPTGELRPVQNTPFDFLEFHKIGERISANDEQIKIGSGYDHTYVIDKKVFGELSLAASAYSEVTGIQLDVLTTLPGVQLYTGNFLDGFPGKQGTTNDRRHGFCLEAQFFPDSPNHGYFPSSILRPGQCYDHTIIFKASIHS